MITIRVERYADVIDEIKPLLAMHWEEIANNRDEIPLDPNYEQYAALDKAGVMVILAARKDGALVGYSIFMLIRHPHYTSTVFAMNDILFVHPAHRGGSAGVRLIDESYREMKARGAKKISWHIKTAPEHNFSPILERRGYVNDELILSKIIKD